MSEFIYLKKPKNILLTIANWICAIGPKKRGLRLHQQCELLIKSWFFWSPPRHPKAHLVTFPKSRTSTPHPSCEVSSRRVTPTSLKSSTTHHQQHHHQHHQHNTHHHHHYQHHHHHHHHHHRHQQQQHNPPSHTLTHSLEGLNLWCGFLGGGLEP